MQEDFSGQFFRIFEIFIFCFVVAICDLVHAVEAISPNLQHTVFCSCGHFFLRFLSDILCLL